MIYLFRILTNYLIVHLMKKGVIKNVAFLLEKEHVLSISILRSFILIILINASTYLSF